MGPKPIITLRYTLYGALFGLMFPIFATLADLFIQGRPLSLENLWQVQRGSALHWIIDTAPFFLGLFAGFTGRVYSRLLAVNEQMNQSINERDQAIGELQKLQAQLEEQVVARTRDLERRVIYLRAASEVGQAAAVILDTDQLLHHVVELARQQFDLYYVGLFLLDEFHEWAVLRAGTGKAGRTMLARGHRIRIGEGMIGWSIANARARIAGQAETDTIRLTTSELPLTRSEAAIPLQSRGRVLGALTIQSAHPNAFDEGLLTTLQLMADQIAVALDNATLFADRQRAIEEQRRAYAQWGRETWNKSPYSKQKLGFRRDRTGLSSADSVAETQIGTFDANDTQIDGRHIALPVKIRDNVIGTITATMPVDRGPWRDEELRVFQILVNQLGSALEDARLYQDLQQRAHRERLITDITGKIRAAPDIDGILRTTVQEMRRALGVSHGVIRLGTEIQFPPDVSPNWPGRRHAIGRSSDRKESQNE